VLRAKSKPDADGLKLIREKSQISDAAGLAGLNKV
jgi:hypothetical protein